MSEQAPVSTAASGGSPTSTPPPMKSGITTSEAWLTIGHVITASLVVYFHWSDTAANAFERGWVALGALAASASVVVTYIFSRTSLKKAQMEAQVGQKKDGG